MKIVLDANIYISFFLTRGKTIASIFSYWKKSYFTVLVSPLIVEEIKNSFQYPKIRKELKAKDIIVVAVHTSRIERAKLDEWIQENSISLPIGMIQSDQEQTRFNWGIRSLPWLILTDKEHIVRAEGFALTELDDKVEVNN